MARKKIKIKYVDFWAGFKAEDFILTKLLQKYFEVEISDEADYVIFSCFGESHWNISDKCVKIFFTGENFCPDFNACDYAAGFEWMTYEDRYCRFPLYLAYSEELLRKAEGKHLLTNDCELNELKTEFCSFVVSNPFNEKRNEAFHNLSRYKKVNSGGACFNNVGGRVKDKFAFESKHKFSLCYENGAHNGYTTEKLVEALAARTVPIYWGDPKIGNIFNTRAFINVSDFDSFEDVIEYVKKVDSDDELYLSILKEPALKSTSDSFEKSLEDFEKWLITIFELPIEDAYRRPRELFIKRYIQNRRNALVAQNYYDVMHLIKLKKQMQRRLWDARAFISRNVKPLLVKFHKKKKLYDVCRSQ